MAAPVVGTVGHRRLTYGLIAALATLAWFLLWAWGTSSYAHYLDHDAFVEASGLLPALTIGGWVLMTVAMMLPTTLPVVGVFERMTAARPDGRRLVTLLLIGYLSVWSIFGVAVHAADVVVHRMVAGAAWLESSVLIAAVLVVAAVYQLSPLRQRCLAQCRSPLMFVAQRWTGRDELRRAFRLGADHGAFCVGCCWALMLLMFAVGTGNLAWMLGLGGVMAIEKNFSWGRRLTAPLAVALITAAAATVLL